MPLKSSILTYQAKRANTTNIYTYTRLNKDVKMSLPWLHMAEHNFIKSLKLIQSIKYCYCAKLTKAKWHSCVKSTMKQQKKEGIFTIWLSLNITNLSLCYGVCILVSTCHDWINSSPHRSFLKTLPIHPPTM